MFFNDESLYCIVMLYHFNKIVHENTSIQDIHTNKNNRALIVLFYFISSITPPLLVSEIMLPLFSLPTIALRRGKESCSISLSRTLLSVLGCLSATGQLGQLVSDFCCTSEM